MVKSPEIRNPHVFSPSSVRNLGLLHLISLGDTLLIGGFQAATPRTKETALLPGKVRLEALGEPMKIKAWNKWEASLFWIFQVTLQFGNLVQYLYQYWETIWNNIVTTFCICLRGAVLVVFCMFAILVLIFTRTLQSKRTFSIGKSSMKWPSIRKRTVKKI